MSRRTRRRLLTRGKVAIVLPQPGSFTPVTVGSSEPSLPSSSFARRRSPRRLRSLERFRINVNPRDPTAYSGPMDAVDELYQSSSRTVWALNGTEPIAGRGDGHSRSGNRGAQRSLLVRSPRRQLSFPRATSLVNGPAIL